MKQKLLCALQLPWKILRSILLTMYDDFDFKYPSLPRMAAFALTSLVIISVIGEQFFDKKYANFGQLVGAAMAALASYVAKKKIDEKKKPDE